MEEETFQDSFEDSNERAPGETHREGEYLRQLAQRQVPVVVKLRSGEVVRGFIEYYDRRFVRVTRSDGPNLFIFKSEIKYLYEGQPASPGARATPLPPRREPPGGPRGEEPPAGA
jgi:sRNA-binding regulator protein Hfq